MLNEHLELSRIAYNHAERVWVLIPPLTVPAEIITHEDTPAHLRRRIECVAGGSAAFTSIWPTDSGGRTVIHLSDGPLHSENSLLSEMKGALEAAFLKPPFEDSQRFQTGELFHIYVSKFVFQKNYLWKNLHKFTIAPARDVELDEIAMQSYVRKLIRAFMEIEPGDIEYSHKRREDSTVFGVPPLRPAMRRGAGARLRGALKTLAIVHPALKYPD